MKQLTKHLLTLGALVALLLGISGPAAAGEPIRATQGRVVAEVVPGLGDFPVTCKTVNDGDPNANTFTQTVTCTADDAAVRVTQVCVPSTIVLRGTTITRTVCSDYQPLIDALQVPTTVNTDTKQLAFGCGLTDFMCLSIETTARNVAQWVVDSISWVFEASAFNTSSTLWTVAKGEAGFWWTIVLFIVLGTVIVGITLGSILGNKKITQRAIIGLFATFGTTWVVINALGYVLDAVDGLSAPILQHGLTNGTIADTVKKLMFPTDMSAVIQTLSPLTATIPLVLLAAGLGVAAFVNSIRDFGLMTLIAFAPLAFALMPAGAGATWIRNWCSGVVALLLTKPLVLGLLVMVMAGLGQVDSIYSIQALPLFYGLFMTLLMPIAAFSLFSFVGGQAAAQFEGAGARFTGAARSAAQSFRSGARSFGRTPGGGRGQAGGPGRNGAGNTRPAGKPAGRPGRNTGTPSTPENPTPPTRRPGRPSTLDNGRFPTSGPSTPDPGRRS